MSAETLSSVSMGAEIASASLQPISSVAESGIDFSFNASIGSEVLPSIINAPQSASENIFNLPTYKPNFDPKIIAIVPEITANSLPPINLPELNIQTFNLEKPAESQKPIVLEPEAQADIIEFSKTISSLQTFGFTKEEEQKWADKFKKALQEKSAAESEPPLNILPQTAEQVEVDLLVQVETQAKAEAQAQAETAGQPPVIPPKIEIGALDNNESSGPKKTKKPKWEMFTLDNQKRVAKDSLKKRVGVAKDIVEEATLDDPEDIASAIEARIYKLDVPDIAESARIVQGELTIPAVSQYLSADVVSVRDGQDIAEVHNTIVRTLYNHAPTEKVGVLQPGGTIEKEQLPGGAKELAEEGARVIVLRKNRWVPLEKPSFKDPIEFDKKAA